MTSPYRWVAARWIMIISGWPNPMCTGRHRRAKCGIRPSDDASPVCRFSQRPGRGGADCVHEKRRNIHRVSHQPLLAVVMRNARPVLPRSIPLHAEPACGEIRPLVDVCGAAPCGKLPEFHAVVSAAQGVLPTAWSAQWCRAMSRTMVLVVGYLRRPEECNAAAELGYKSAVSPNSVPSRPDRYAELQPSRRAYGKPEGLPDYDQHLHRPQLLNSLISRMPGQNGYAGRIARLWWSAIRTFA